jgi:hypothetical protein
MRSSATHERTKILSRQDVEKNPYEVYLPLQTHLIRLFLPVIYRRDPAARGR